MSLLLSQSCWRFQLFQSPGLFTAVGGGVGDFLGPWPGGTRPALSRALWDGGKASVICLPLC